MQLSLGARYYIILAACVVVAVLGVWLAGSALQSVEGGWQASFGIVVGLVLIIAAIFGIVECAHACVVTVAASIDDCARQAAQLIADARQKVQIVAGEGSAQFYDRPEVAKAISDALQRGVSVEIVIGSQATATSETLLGLVDSGRIALYTLNYVPSPHFMVVDSRAFRIESPHPLGAPTREGFAWRRGVLGARDLEEHFAALRAEAEQWGQRAR
ncbi:MAG: hypothetical protein ACE5O2_16035 [Armatimonadota bacterium]